MLLTSKTDTKELMKYSYFIDENGKIQGRQDIVWIPTGKLWIVDYFKDGIFDGPHFNLTDDDMSCILYYKNGIEFGQQSFGRTMKSSEKLLS